MTRERRAELERRVVANRKRSDYMYASRGRLLSVADACATAPRHAVHRARETNDAELPAAPRPSPLRVVR